MIFSMKLYSPPTPKRHMREHVPFFLSCAKRDGAIKRLRQ